MFPTTIFMVTKPLFDLHSNHVVHVGIYVKQFILKLCSVVYMSIYPAPALWQDTKEHRIKSLLQTYLFPMTRGL